MAHERLLSKEDLYEEDFPWTIIDGRVYAIGEFIPRHPGGPLIRRAIGEDASALFATHHSGQAAGEVLRRYCIGRIRGEGPSARPFQEALNKRAAGLERAPESPLAEAVALVMLALFGLWVVLCYRYAWWRLNAALSWFWWRHLDSGLHSAVHGDFRSYRALQWSLTRVYSTLSHRAVEYYFGREALQGTGLSKHFWHHVYTNDPGRDPDWATMSDMAWVRRHRSAPWQPCHTWQRLYWLPVTALVEPMLELLQVWRELLEATGALLEPPSAAEPGSRRLGAACCAWAALLLNPGYQGAAFLFQPWWQAFAVLALARAVARLALFPFSEVQHYMPEHMDEEPQECRAGFAGQKEGEEWAVTQLRRTANLRLANPLARLVDFLMFHGDSHQIEHHLWPAMSFVQYRHAARIVRETCEEFGVPYYEIGYWEGYAKIWRQVVAHSARAEPVLAEGANSGEAEPPLVPAGDAAHFPVDGAQRGPTKRALEEELSEGAGGRLPQPRRRRMTCAESPTRA